MRRGIYRPGGDCDPFRVAVAAAILASAGSDPVASHRCAAHLHGLPLLELPARPELTLASDSPTMAIKGCSVHHDRIPPWQRNNLAGVVVTDHARTLFDLSIREPFVDAVLAVDAALHRRLTTHEELARVAAPYRGSRLFRRFERVLVFADARSASPGESLARVMFAEQGLPKPALAELIRIGGVVVAEVDFLWREEMTVGEFDGRLKYVPGNDRGEDALWQEKLREDRLREAGFEVVRMTWAQVREQPAQTAERIRAAFARGITRSTGR